MNLPEQLFSLQGKTAVVIGGTGELCGAMAEGLAGAGVETVLVGRSQKRPTLALKISNSGGNAYFKSCDVETLLHSRNSSTGFREVRRCRHTCKWCWDQFADPLEIPETNLTAL